MHALRVLTLIAIVLLIRARHRAFLAAQAAAGTPPPPLERVQQLFPAAAAVRDSADGTWDVLDETGRRLGMVLQTAPESDPVIGFSGPSNLLIALDPAGRVAGLAVLSSRDTPEHVAQVVNDPTFLRGFDGLTWDEAANRRRVDAVAGATLTSLAMAEGVERRLGGRPASLKFADPVTVADVRPLFPTADRVETDPGEAAVIRVYGPDGRPIGWALRTSPAADNTVGFQGPTDALVGFDPQGRVVGLAVRRSYDNEPYVRYVREDEAFRATFDGKTMEDLAGLDLRADDVEGVAGATMTSQAVAKGVVLAAGAKRAKDRPPPAPPAAGAAVPWADVGTAGVILAALVLGFTNLRGNRWVRATFQLVVFGYLGLVNGALLSQAQFVGWAQAGVPRGAAGLILLTAAAVLVPITARRNLYCTHLCPHGALQQLTLRVARPRRVVPPRLRAVLRLIPPGLLVLSLAVALGHWPVNLAQVEPFDAYLVRVAGGATLAIAVVGAVASLFVPMAYCRYGCPTGALVEYLRRNAHSDRLSVRDGLAAACLLAAVGLWGVPG